MNKYEVTITETLQKKIIVMADSEEEAEEMACDAWYRGDLVLDSDDFTGEVEYSVKQIPTHQTVLPKNPNVNELKLMFPMGTKIELIHMDDKQAPPPGTRGIVTSVDDLGTIHISWQTGSTLGLVYGVDKFKVIEGCDVP